MILPCELWAIDVIEDYARENPVIIPTDTLYGLSMSIYGDLRRIYALKAREPAKKISVGVYDKGMIENIAVLDERAERLIEKFMPGALTIVLESKIPKITGSSVGVRVPKHPIPRELSKRIGPITLTSANISGERNPRNIKDTCKLEVPYRIDCGELLGKPSTVVSLLKEVKLIRVGAIPFSAILKVLEE